MSGLISADHHSDHGFAKVSRESPSAQTGGKRANGTTTKDASGVPDSIQETDHSVFRLVRSQPLGTVVSIWTRYHQQCDCSVLHTVLSTSWLALLVCRRSRRLFPNLS